MADFTRYGVLPDQAEVSPDSKPSAKMSPAMPVARRIVPASPTALPLREKVVDVAVLLHGFAELAEEAEGDELHGQEEQDESDEAAAKCDEQEDAEAENGSLGRLGGGEFGGAVFRVVPCDEHHAEPVKISDQAFSHFGGERFTLKDGGAHQPVQLN